VGFSQVSKDWRFTFISSAASIWSQGLGAVAGEIAYAIVLILACSLFHARPVYLFCLRNSFPRRKALGLASICCCSALTMSGASMKFGPI
jgi:hypothetical protein